MASAKKAGKVVRKSSGKSGGFKPISDLGSSKRNLSKRTGSKILGKKSAPKL